MNKEKSYIVKTYFPLRAGMTKPISREIAEETKNQLQKDFPGIKSVVIPYNE